VTNVANFGAFVDIGVHQDGLVHVSQLADRYISDPKEVVKVGQVVSVKVLEIDLKLKRVALSMRSGKEERSNQREDRNSDQFSRRDDGRGSSGNSAIARPTKRR
jgi:protein Tex